MSRVVAYIRVSTESQDVENQLTGIEFHAKRNNLSIDEVAGETISGYKSQLQERKFHEVIEGLSSGDTLIVSETSRISRRLLDVLNIIQKLLDKGVSVIAVKENIVFKDDINSKVLAFAFGLSAEIERSLISARTREALSKKKAEGFKLGRPVGTAKPENLKLYGKDQQIIDFMLADMPFAAIARYLHVHRETLRRYVRARGIDKEVLWNRHTKTGV